MGGGGALVAAGRRPSLLTAVGMAPYVPDGILSGSKIPAVLFGGQIDTTVTPAYLGARTPRSRPRSRAPTPRSPVRATASRPGAAAGTRAPSRGS
jgi:hypothetical protein